jgi:drug/metabolite transporter (DMT)-like permease
MSQHVPSLRRGITLMVASSFCFSVMAYLQQISVAAPAMKSLFRFVVGMALLGSLALAGRIKLEFKSGWLLYARGISGGLSIFLLFLAMNKLGVGTGTVLAYTYPVFGAILGALFLKERFGPIAWLAIFACLPGIWMVCAKPGEQLSLSQFGIWELLAIVGAMCSAVAVTIIKLLHNTESSYSIFFSQCTLGVWLMLIPANMMPVELTVNGGLLLVAVGFSAAFGQLLMTEGYRHTTATVGSLCGMLTPVLNVAVQVVILREPLPPLAAWGTIIILGCTVVVILDGQGVLRFARQRVPAA